MSIIRLSVFRPILMIMVIFSFVVLGLYSYLDLGIELFPQVDFPFVTIRTVYVGAGPVEIENLITKHIEEEVSAINGVKDITSTSIEGASIIAIEFEIGIDVDLAAIDVKDKIELVKSRLPEDAEDPVVMKFDMGAEAVMKLAISGDRPLDEIYEITDNVIKPELMKIQGLASVGIVGGKIREIQVRVRREMMKSQNIGIMDVVTGLAVENLNIPSGHVTEDRKEFNIRVNGEFETVNDIEDIILTVKNGRNVRLRDVAYIVDDFEEQRMLARFNGQPSVGVTLTKRSDANVVEVVDNVVRNLDKVNELLPDDMRIQVASDNSTFIRRSIAEVVNNMGIGIILTGVILFLFLHTWQGTIIAALSMPTAIVSTFILMRFAGFTLNFMTLLGLAVTVGVLVTNSIVVLENIIRYTKMDKTLKEACVEGTSGIATAVAASTMTNVVVFTPIAFMGGIVGQFFFSFGLTVAFATIFSLFVSLTLTPLLSSKMLKSEKVKTYGFDMFALGILVLLLSIIILWVFNMLGNMISGAAGTYGYIFSILAGLALCGLTGKTIYGVSIPELKERVIYKIWFHLLKTIIYSGIMYLVYLLFDFLFPTSAALVITAFLILMIVLNIRFNIFEKFGRSWNRMYDKFAADYKESLTWALNHQGLIILGIIAVLILSLSLFKYVGSEFMPSSDVGYLSVAIEMPPGTNMDLTNKTLFEIEEALKDTRGVENVYTVLGESPGASLGMNQGVQYGEVVVKLVPLAERDFRTEDVINDLKQDLIHIPMADITLKERDSGPGGGGADIEVEITGNDIDILNDIAVDMISEVKNIPGAIDVRSSSKEGVPEFQIVPNRKKLADYGISVATLAGVMRTNIDGNVATKYRVGNKEYDIRVKLDRSYLELAEQVKNISIRCDKGDIPLTEIAEIVQKEGPTSVDRKNKKRSVTVKVNAQDRSVGDIQADIQAVIDTRELQTGYAIGFAGSAEIQAEAFYELLKALVLAILLTFIVLAAILESYIQPFIIMMTLPLALIGVVLSLVISGKTVSIISLMAIVMLVGIVVNNGILLIEYMQRLRNDGMGLREAILEAASVRLRPIIMTNLATIFSMMPLALELGEGAEFRSPMAIVSIGALITSTFFTLFFIPILYNIIESLKEKSVAKEAVTKP